MFTNTVRPFFSGVIWVLCWYFDYWPSFVVTWCYEGVRAFRMPSALIIFDPVAFAQSLASFQNGVAEYILYLNTTLLWLVWFAWNHGSVWRGFDWCYTEEFKAFILSLLFLSRFSLTDYQYLVKFITWTPEWDIHSSKSPIIRKSSLYLESNSVKV